MAILWILLAQASVTDESSEPKPVQLEPLSNWEIVQKPYGCAVRRSFGAFDKPTTIELRRDEPNSGGFDIAITSAEFDLRDSSFQATLLPDGIEYRPPLPGKERSSTGSIWTVWPHNIQEASKRGITGDEWDRYMAEDGPENFRRRVKTLEIQDLFSEDLVLPIGAISKPRRQLEHCYENVMVANGMPREDAINDSRPVELRNSRKLLRSLLPSLPPVYFERIKQKKQVSVSFAVFLDADAQPTRCRLTTVPRYSQLEKAGCDKLIKNGRYRFKRNEERRPAMIQAGYLYREDIGFITTGG